MIEDPGIPEVVRGVIEDLASPTWRVKGIEDPCIPQIERKAIEGTNC